MCFTVLFYNRFLHINTVATLLTILVFILVFFSSGVFSLWVRPALMMM
jgi:hypothetical protein